MLFVWKSVGLTRNGPRTLLQWTLYFTRHRADKIGRNKEQNLFTKKETNLEPWDTSPWRSPPPGGQRMYTAQRATPGSLCTPTWCWNRWPHSLVDWDPKCVLFRCQPKWRPGSSLQWSVSANTNIIIACVLAPSLSRILTLYQHHNNDY